MPIDVPTPDLNPQEIQSEQMTFVTEVACDALINGAIKHGVLSAETVNPHLAYLPDENAIQQFKDACKAVIASVSKEQVQGQ